MPENDLRLRSLIDLEGFWRLFDTRHPNSGPWTFDQRRNRQNLAADIGVIVSIYISEEKSLAGVFFGRNAKRGIESPATKLGSVADRLREKLDEQPWTAAPSESFHSIWRVDLMDERNWPAVCDWLVVESERFERAVRAVL